MNENQQIPQNEKATAPKKKLKGWQIALIIIGCVIVIGVIFSNKDSDEAQKTSTSSVNSAASVSPTEYKDVNYITLYNNSGDYKDKYVKICGKINSVGKNVAGTTYITIKDGLPSGITTELYCNILDNKADSVSAYKEGDYVEITGKVGDKTINSLNIDDCEVVSSGDSVKKKIDEYSKQEESSAKAESSLKQKEDKENKKSYINSCKEYTYKEVARNPKNYSGKKAKFNGEVVQVVENGNNVVLRVNVTKEANEFADNGYLYSDTIYVEYTYKSDNESRILEDDIIDIYGTLNGTKTYSSTLGGNITIPYLLAEYVDIKS